MERRRELTSEGLIGSRERQEEEQRQEDIKSEEESVLKRKKFLHTFTDLPVF